MTPRQTSDLLEIQQLIYRYAWLIDTRDFAALDTVFAPGAEIHYNVFGGVKQTWPEIQGFLRMGLSLHRVTQHQMSNPMVELAGDHATARTYGNLVHVQELLDGKPSYVVQHAIYHDALARGTSGWRITSRRLDNLFVQGRFLGPDRVKTFEKPQPD
jgi:3-phenylpropionate/cinnamic acid dioxygenase small subunit